MEEEDTMKKIRSHAWLFPTCLLIFLSIYLLVKFIFIFFFSAAYEPHFIFEFTPLYLLSGVSNAQLLSLSLMAMIVDLLLHLRSGKRNLLLSFLPTTVMLSSIGFVVMVSPMDLSYVFHYSLFGVFLLVVLIDYQSVLKGVETPMMRRKKEPISMNIAKEEPLVIQRRFLFTKNAKLSQRPAEPFVAESILELKKVSDAILQNMQVIVDDLERKTVRIERLEQVFEEQKNLIQHEKMFPKQGISSFQPKEKVCFDGKKLERHISTEEEIVLKEKIENHLIIDGMNDIVAVIQRGIFKEISNAFADFLGYERTELLQKNFFVFISPRGFEDARKYYLNRLKGVTANTFRTVLLTKERSELLVEVTVTSTVYKGDSAEFLTVNEVKNNS
jgi:PAS domain S-box-containing protein